MDLIGSPSCGNCKFAHDGTGPNSLICRRMPPTPTLLMQMTKQGPVPSGVLGNFPPVQSSQWCGEHKRKLEGLN